MPDLACNTHKVARKVLSPRAGCHLHTARLVIQVLYYIGQEVATTT